MSRGGAKAARAKAAVPAVDLSCGACTACCDPVVLPMTLAEIRAESPRTEYGRLST